jgi:hypothetical protein
MIHNHNRFPHNQPDRLCEPVRSYSGNDLQDSLMMI